MRFSSSSSRKDTSGRHEKYCKGWGATFHGPSRHRNILTIKWGTIINAFGICSENSVEMILFNAICDRHDGWSIFFLPFRLTTTQWIDLCCVGWLAQIGRCLWLICWSFTNLVSTDRWPVFGTADNGEMTKTIEICDGDDQIARDASGLSLTAVRCEWNWHKISLSVYSH